MCNFQMYVVLGGRWFMRRRREESMPSQSFFSTAERSPEAKLANISLCSSFAMPGRDCMRRRGRGEKYDQRKANKLFHGVSGGVVDERR